MTLTTARRMIGAEILKLRKKRSTIAWTTFLAAGAIAIYYLYAALEHTSDPAHHGPAGDHAAGVFRDLVATGRSRLALFSVRIPAALIITFAAMSLGLAVAVVASVTLAGGHPTPTAGLIVKGAGWVLLANAIICILAVGLASLSGSRAVTLNALIGWELVVSPQLVTAAGLGSTRNVLIDGALLRIEPPPLPNGTPHLSMTIATVILVLALWPLAATLLGAWRTRSRDA